MVDSSDFEAFYRQEVEKAQRVLPPSSSYGMTVAPSRHLFFAREEEERVQEDVESESTLQNEALFYPKGAFGASKSREACEVIDTFRKFPNDQEAVARHILSSAVSSAHGKEEEANSKTTFFESPYWPG